MKITVSQGKLLSKLKLVGKNILPNKVNHELESFYFQVRDNTLYISGSDEASVLTTSVDCIIEEHTKKESIFTVNAKTLLDALKEIPEQPLTLSLSFQPKFVNILATYINGKFEIIGGTGDLFPSIPYPAEDATFLKVSSLDLASGLKQTYFRCASDDLRPTLTGVYMDHNAKGLAFVGTDGSTLGLKEYKFDGGPRCAFIIPERISKVLVDIISPDDYNMTVSVDSMRALFEHEDFILNCRHIEGRFPNYRSVIPANNDKICKAGKADILAALKRVSVFCNKHTSLIKFSLMNNQLVIAAQDLDYSTSADETINVDYEGPEIAIGFKSYFLIDLISNIPSSEIVLYLADPSRAALIKGTESTEEFEDLTYLIMPMMLNY